MQDITIKRIRPSNWLKSILRDEVKGCCPKCGCAEIDSKVLFDIHHIDGNKENTEYWNLIYMCRKCHDICETRRGDDSYTKKQKRYKKYLFRDFIGPASYDVLLMAFGKGSVLTFPWTARILLDLELVKLEQDNAGHFGSAKAKPAFSVYDITEQGKEWIKELNLNWRKEGHP